MESLLNKNSELIIQWMDHIEDEANMLSVDNDLIEIMNYEGKQSSSDILHQNLKLKRILNKYFLGIKGVFSYHLYTDKYMMVGNVSDPTAPNSKPAMYLPYDVFPNSELNIEARKGNGKLSWIPTYSYYEMYGLSDYDSIDNKEKYFFSAVKQINCIDNVKDGRFQPILIISFLPEYFDNLLKDNNLSMYFPEYYVYSPQNGSVIYDYDCAKLTQSLSPDITALMEHATDDKSSSYISDTNIIAFNKVPELEWNQIISIPTAAYTKEMTIRPNLLLCLSVALTVALCFIVYSITKNISNKFGIVLRGIQSFGAGNLNTRIPEIDDCDFSVLADSFNRMGNQMQTLIEENYETKLRESETQIMALNMQMNPHFLYNTLSIINWMAIDNNETEISNALIHLSKMLQYSFRNKKVFCSVSEELEWLNDYLYIMDLRFKGKFQITTDICDNIYETLIPRLTFQPIIENSIVHGFEDIESGGQITIRGFVDENARRVFELSDNGVGMTQEEIDTVLNRSDTKIGLANLNYRIQILYHGDGEIDITSAKNAGTRIRIYLP